MIFGIKHVGNGFILVDIIQDILQQVQSQITVGAELVSEWPYHTIQDGIEVGLVEGVEEAEVELDQWFQKGEEVSADLWEGVEVGGD